MSYRRALLRKEKRTNEKFWNAEYTEPAESDDKHDNRYHSLTWQRRKVKNNAVL